MSDLLGVGQEKGPRRSKGYPRIWEKCELLYRILHARIDSIGPSGATVGLLGLGGLLVAVGGVIILGFLGPDDDPATGLLLMVLGILVWTVDAFRVTDWL